MYLNSSLEQERRIWEGLGRGFRCWRAGFAAGHTGTTPGMCGSDSQCSPVWPPIQNGKRIGKSASVVVKIPDVLGRLTKILGTFLLGPS